MWMCEKLQVPRSSFYAWRQRVGVVTESQARREELKVLIQKIYKAHDGTYGCRRIAAELNGQGHPASVGLVAKRMRERGLAGIQPRSYKTSTVRGKAACRFSALPAGDSAPHAPHSRPS